MANKASITGIILTLNEEADLPRSISSLSWCDSIIVVDSGSTDSTEAIARSGGCLFVQNIQSGLFLITEQRNWILDSGLIQTDWVIFLDADEAIGESLSLKILQVINSESPDEMYELTPRYWFMGRWLRLTQGFPNWHPRLLKTSSVRFAGGIWESFDSPRPPGRVPIPYEHYAFSKGFDDWVTRHLRYARWDAQKIINSGSKPELYTTKRFRNWRNSLDKVWLLRPCLRFIQKYILQRGFMEGWQGLLYSLMISMFDFFVVIYVIQYKRLASGRTL